MVVAVVFDKETEHVYPHFGSAPYLKIYRILEGGQIKQELHDAPGSGHESMVQYLKDNEVNALICDDIGAGAFNALEAENIEVFAGYDDFADVCVLAYMKNNLFKALGPTCNHSHDEEGCHCGGDCGDCGECV